VTHIKGQLKIVANVNQWLPYDVLKGVLESLTGDTSGMTTTNNSTSSNAVDNEAVVPLLDGGFPLAVMDF